MALSILFYYDEQDDVKIEAEQFAQQNGDSIKHYKLNNGVIYSSFAGRTLRLTLKDDFEADYQLNANN